MKDLLYRAIDAHWRQHRPNVVKRLDQQGRLEQAVERAARLTSDAETQAIRNAMPAPAAQELYRQRWAFLPSEEDVPDLMDGPSRVTSDSR